MIHLSRLHVTLQAAGVPITGLDLNGQVQPSGLQAAAQPFIDAFDDSAAAQAAWENLQQRETAKAGFATGLDDRAKAWRAIVSLLLDENNALRSWIMGFKAAEAAATSFADHKTRVAALPNMPDRTLAQAKAAFLAKIDGGTVD